MKQQVKTDLEMIPEVTELRGFMRETKFRGGKLVVTDLANYVSTLKKMIPIYLDLKDRKHYKNTVRYIEFKLGMIMEVLRNNYGINVSAETKEE